METKFLVKRFAEYRSARGGRAPAQAALPGSFKAIP